MHRMKHGQRLLSTGVLALTLTASATHADVFVNGYLRSDGVYVQPHWRSDPDGIAENNFSYPDNLNPYTGKIAPGGPFFNDSDWASPWEDSSDSDPWDDE